MEAKSKLKIFLLSKLIDVMIRTKGENIKINLLVKIKKMKIC